MADAVVRGAKAEGAVSVVISAAIEAEVAQLQDEAEKAEFLSSLGLTETGLTRVIRAGYALLDLITFLDMALPLAAEPSSTLQT